MTIDSLELRFGPGSPTGFTPAGIAGFGDLRPEAVVRELIQNSLDAAVEADVKTAIVRFRLTRRKTRDIPGIQSYLEAFCGAVKSQKDRGGGVLPSQAERVVHVIENALDQDDQEILSIVDNGIGLNATRMNALLSDGISAKGGAATGTFGNGHSVVIPASNLRYVLYGGITKNGYRIGSGHAVLASRIVPKEEHQRSGDGFLVKGFRNGTYLCANDSLIPDLIADDLEDIRQLFGHGTSVIILGFNNFREDEALWKMVSKGASCNFFQAIEENRLVIQFEDLRSGQSIDSNSLHRSNLKAVLEANRDEKRSRSLLSGQKAFEAHEALQSGESHVVQTSLGKIGIRLYERPSGSPRVDLCRNGMWITSDKNLPGFYYQFQDRKPFHALLLLDSDSGGRLHELVRNAEGPLHDKLDAKQRLSPSEASELRSALRDIREWLRARVPEISSDSYTPDDFLVLDFGNDGEEGKARPSFWGTPVPVIRRDPSLSQNDFGPNPFDHEYPPHPPHAPQPPKPPHRPRPILRPFFQAASIPKGSGHRRIHLEFQENCKDAELRLRVDENVDATCDHLRRNENETVFLKRVKIGGRNVQGNKLTRVNGRITGVRLGDIAANASVQIEITYLIPSRLAILAEQEPALRVEVFSTPRTNDEET